MVGNNEDSVSEVRGTNCGRWYAFPFRIVPEAGQVSEYAVHSGPSNKETWYIFHEHEAWSNSAKDALKLWP